MQNMQHKNGALAQSAGALLVKAIVLALVLGTFVSSAASAENWPMFRGPSGQGISSETNLPTQWSTTSNIAWKANIPGEGWSSPIIWDNQIFLTYTLDKGASCHIISIDRTTGATLWDTETFKQSPGRKEGRNSYATPTPVTDGQHVYAFFAGGGAAGLDFSGKLIWKNTDNSFYSQHGLAASPILYKDLVLMPWDHNVKGGPEPKLGWQIPWDKAYVLALDKKSGHERYRAMRGMSRIGHMTPRIVNVDGKPQLVSAAGDIIEGFDPDTGQRIWWVQTGGEGVTPSPVFGNGVVFSSTGFPTPVGNKEIHPAIQAFRLGGQGDVTRTNFIWEQRKDVPMIPSLLLVDHLLYSIKENGILQCLDAADGNVIYRQRLDGNFSASPLFADGRIYLINDAGLTTIIQPGREFKQIGQNNLDEPAQAGIAVANHQLFIRTASHLYCIGKGDSK